jgi:4-hydroxy 2-oxovalerate aldolase|tara:strand:- start:577 stop:1590 length:1014 start_codon:yes stop_codon:yes gene_type:complete
MQKNIKISDATLRDGNHAIRHKISGDQIKRYCIAAEKAKIDIIEIGHGNGLGASSIQIGLANLTDKKMLEIGRKYLNKTKLGIHVIPGFATIEDIKKAIKIGVDIFRIASHCTEADITERHINYVREKNIQAYGVLMMSHMASKERLLEEAKKMKNYGAQGIILMDSAGSYLPNDVKEKVSLLKKNLKNISIGFHAHNNLGLSIPNSVEAVRAGATIIDGCARGFGAGAGNTQLEVLIAVFKKLKIKTNVDLYKVLDCGDVAEEYLIEKNPSINSSNIVSGMAGVFSGFIKNVTQLSKEYNVNPRDVFFELGRRKAVAGQEDLIIEVVKKLKKNLHK